MGLQKKICLPDETVAPEGRKVYSFSACFLRMQRLFLMRLFRYNSYGIILYVAEFFSLFRKRKNRSETIALSILISCKNYYKRQG
jgi:hypothetical protein